MTTKTAPEKKAMKKKGSKRPEKKAKKEHKNLLGAFKSLIKHRFEKKGGKLGTRDEIVSRIRKDIALDDIRAKLLKFYVTKAKKGAISNCHILTEDKDGNITATAELGKGETRKPKAKKDKPSKPAKPAKKKAKAAEEKETAKKE